MAEIGDWREMTSKVQGIGIAAFASRTGIVNKMFLGPDTKNKVYAGEPAGMLTALRIAQNQQAPSSLSRTPWFRSMATRTSEGTSSRTSPQVTRWRTGDTRGQQATRPLGHTLLSACVQGLDGYSRIKWMGSRHGQMPLPRTEHTDSPTRTRVRTLSPPPCILDSRTKVREILGNSAEALMAAKMMRSCGAIPSFTGHDDDLPEDSSDDDSLL